FEGQTLEGEAQALAGRFGGEAVAPAGPREPPADFDTRSELRLEGWHVQAHEADEGAALAQLRRPEPPALSRDLRLRSPREAIAFCAAETAGHELHDLRIGVEGRERLEIARAPLPQPKTPGAEIGHADQRLQGLRMPVLSNASARSPTLELFVGCADLLSE